MKWISEKRLFQLHGWLGLNFGLLLFLICFAGTCAVFSHEIDWLIEPALRVEPPADGAAQPLRWEDIRRSVVEAHPHATISYIDGPEDARTAARAAIAYNRDDLRWVFVDPYTCEVTGQSTMLNVASFFRIFHKQFYILRSDYWPHGRVFVCVFSFVLLFSAVTGLLFYKKWWRSLWRLRFTHGRRVFWSDLHRMVGIWSLLFAVMFSATGLWYLAAQLMIEFDIEYQPGWTQLEEDALQQREAVLTPLPLSAIVERAVDAFPGFKVESVFPANTPGESVTLMGQADAVLVAENANRVHLDPYSGEVLSVVRGDELPLDQRLIETTDPLHFGQFGGLLTKTIWFLAGLAISAGILVGAYIWWLRVTRSKPRFFRKSRGWTAAALLMNLAVLALMVYSTIAFIGNQVHGPRATVAPTPLGEAVAGPWRVQAFRHGPVGGESLPISLTFTGGHPNYRAAAAWIGEEPGDGGTPLRGFVDQLQGQISLPTGGAAAKQLHIRLEAHDGQHHTASFSLRLTDAAAPLTIPPAPGVPMGVWVVIAVFVGVSIFPTFVWLALVR